MILIGEDLEEDLPESRFPRYECEIKRDDRRGAGFRAGRRSAIYSGAFTDTDLQHEINYATPQFRRRFRPVKAEAGNCFKNLRSSA